jgi:hypothetical protein
MIAALPAALSFRFFFGAAFAVGVAVGATDVCGSGLPLYCGPHLALGLGMALRPAALTFRRAGFSGAGAGTDSDGSLERASRKGLWR